MINYCTYIDVPKSVFDIAYKNRLMFIGSCFADNIGAKMREYRFSVDVNPFGVLYNPLSVASASRRLLKPEPFVEDDLFYYNGMYHSFMHHGSFSDVSAGDCLAKINGSLKSAAENFRNISYLVITFGTAYYYQLANGNTQLTIDNTRCTTDKEAPEGTAGSVGHPGQLVANCHKLPAAQFERELLAVDRIVGEWSALIEDAISVNTSLNVIFTVSPIRHWKDGAHFNQISKATLLLAEQKLADKYPDRISYFPAYELMMDELRDYRFYADDMLHPSKVAIDYIWERFCDTYMNMETKAVIKEMESINKALNHRPLSSSVEANKQFLMQTLLKIKQLQDKYPYLCFSKEEKEIASKLQK